MKKNIKLRSALSYLIAAAFLASCSAGYDGASPPVVGDYDMVTFRANVPASSQIFTRALNYGDEYAVETIDVLVFQNGGYAYSVSGVITSPPTGNVGNNTTMEFKAAIIVSEIANDFMIVANARAMIAGLAEGESTADVAAALLLDMPEGGWGSDPTDAEYRKMPMWGYLTNQTLDEAFFEQSHAVKLTRMLARVNVGLDDAITSEKFILGSVRAYNYATKGSLVPDLSFGWDAADFTLAKYTSPSLPAPFGEIRSDGENQWIERTVADGRALTNEIYLFEAPAGVVPASDTEGFVQNPCVVVGGSYEGGATTYYRIDFARENTDIGEMTYMPILRNNSYTIKINSVSGPGYKTPEEAYNSVPMNIDAMIVDWNGNDITTSMTDGVYTLGITSEKYELVPAAHSAPGADNRLTIATNYTDGWTAAVYSDKDCTTLMEGGWLQLSAYSGDENYPSGEQIYFITTELPPEIEKRTAWVKVTAGTMIYKIEVTQVQMYIRITAVGGPNDGQVIGKISFASRNSMLSGGTVPTGIAPASQSFKVEWGPSSTPLRVVRFPAVSTDAMLSWQDASNGITYLTDRNTTVPGEQIFIIDPKPFKAETIAEYPFYSEGTTVVFQLEGSPLMEQITLDMTHYNLLASGIENRIGNVAGTIETATIRCNVPWQMTLADPKNILDLNPEVEAYIETRPYLADANIYGSTHNYNFNGYVGEATFTFSPQPGVPEFDPVVITIFSENMTSRFANSNIVMVKHPVTGEKILTFAETEEDWGDDLDGNGVVGKEIFGERRIIPADAVGLFFKWGSLVGMSPNGEQSESLNQTEVDLSVGPNGEVVFWPWEYNAPADVWVYGRRSTVADNMIPYLSPLDNPDWRENRNPSFNAFENKFPGVGYSAVDGIGDICRYISAQGWVEEEWRMPTQTEFDALLSETISSTQFGAGVSIVPPYDLEIPVQGTDGLYGFTSIPGGRFFGATAFNPDDTANPEAKASRFFPTAGIIRLPKLDSEDVYYQDWPNRANYYTSTTVVPQADESQYKHVGLYGYFFAINALYLNITSYYSFDPETSINAVPVRCVRVETP